MVYTAFLLLVLSSILASVYSRPEERPDDEERTLHFERMMMNPCGTCDGPQCYDGSHCKYGFYFNKCDTVSCFQGPEGRCSEEALCHPSLNCSCGKCNGVHPDTGERYANPSGADCTRSGGWNNVVYHIKSRGRRLY